MNILYTPEAQADLLLIKARIDAFDNPQLVQRILREITKTVRNLGVFPEMGIELRKTLDIPTEYRSIFCRKNYIIYRIEEDTVRIIRILNEKEDFMRILFGIVEVEDDEIE